MNDVEYKAKRLEIATALLAAIASKPNQGSSSINPSMMHFCITAADDLIVMNDLLPQGKSTNE
jgi:hypothetical protein